MLRALCFAVAMLAIGVELADKLTPATHKLITVGGPIFVLVALVGRDWLRWRRGRAA